MTEDDNVLKLRPGDDLRMMQTPDAWPLGRRLALKHGTSDELGVMVMEPNVPRERVYLTNVFDSRLGNVSEDPGCVPHKDYPSLKAIHGDGWLVN